MKRLLISLVAIGLLATTVIPVAASQSNGELVSVQNYDGSIRVSSYAFPMVAAHNASRAQTAAAGSWVTTQLGVSGWYPANKLYDDVAGQVTVCFIHNSYSNLAFMVFADDNYYTKFDAESACRDMYDTPNSLAWYP